MTGPLATLTRQCREHGDFLTTESTDGHGTDPNSAQCFAFRIPNRGFETTKSTKGTKRERENSNRFASKSL